MSNISNKLRKRRERKVGDLVASGELEKARILASEWGISLDFLPGGEGVKENTQVVEIPLIDTYAIFSTKGTCDTTSSDSTVTYVITESGVPTCTKSSFLHTSGTSEEHVLCPASGDVISEVPHKSTTSETTIIEKPPNSKVHENSNLSVKSDQISLESQKCESLEVPENKATSETTTGERLARVYHRPNNPFLRLIEFTDDKTHDKLWVNPKNGPMLNWVVWVRPRQGGGFDLVGKYNARGGRVS